MKKSAKKTQVFNVFMQFLSNFQKKSWLIMSKTFNGDKLIFQEILLKKYMKFVWKRSHFQTETEKRIKKRPIFCISCNYCHIFEQLGEI